MGICIKEALRLIQGSIKEVSFEIVSIENSGNRISAQDIYAKYSLPTYNNSAMDGYGVRLNDTTKIVDVIDSIHAGSHKQTKIEDGQCIKIMTGARIPTSVQAVVPIEIIETVEDTQSRVKLPQNIKDNQHIRFIGEDILKDDLLISKGDEINFATITLLASQGITHIKVYRKPKVSVFTSGEELKLHYEKIEDYQVYNSNTPTLLQRVKELGCEATFTGMAKDTVESLQETITNSLHADFIITTGGVSVGDYDFVQDVIKDKLKCEVLFHGVTIKPGMHILVAKKDEKIIIALPGFAYSSTVCAILYLLPLVYKYKGSNEKLPIVKAKIHQNLPMKMKKTIFTACNVYYENGEYNINFEGKKQGTSAILTNLLHSPALLIQDENSSDIKNGDYVDIVLLNDIK